MIYLSVTIRYNVQKTNLSLSSIIHLSGLFNIMLRILMSKDYVLRVFLSDLTNTYRMENETS